MNHLAPLLALALASCGLDTFDVPVSGRTTVQGALAGITLYAVPLPLEGLTTFDVKESQAFRNQGAEPGDIDSMKLDSLELAVEAPRGATGSTSWTAWCSSRRALASTRWRSPRWTCPTAPPPRGRRWRAPS